MNNKYLVLLVTFITLLFCFAFALDLSPYLRGPNDIIFESHWPYYFINTISKLWLPVLIGTIYILFFIFVDKKISKFNFKREILALLFLVVLVFLFQVSLVYFSRFGITVLFRRIVDSGINGYFTAAINIHDIPKFLIDYPRLLITSLSQHSRGDPPGPILLMYFVVDFFKQNPNISNFLAQFIRSPITDAQSLWIPLLTYQRVAAVFLGFFMHLLSAITIIPFFFLIKSLSSKTTALRAAFIWGVIPSLTFFPLIFDPFYCIFPTFVFLSLAIGYKKNDLRYFFFSGLVFSIGLFFTLSILPILFFLLILLLFLKGRSKINILLSFLLGILIFPLIIFSFGYNSLTSGLVLISSQIPRSYLPWVFYNAYDVFVYMGIPISILFLFFTVNILKNKNFNLLKKLVLSYAFMFVTLLISGVSRGETGRIWIPLMILPVGVVAYYLTEKLKLKSFQIGIVLALVVIQCIILEEFWVPIW